MRDIAALRDLSKNNKLIIKSDKDDGITTMDSIHYNNKIIGGARDVIVIVVGNGHGDTSSNPGRD